MRVLPTLLVTLVLPTAALVAQEPVAQDTLEAEQLRGEIERRFAERVRQELALSDEQARKLWATQQRFGERRRGLVRSQAENLRALQRQMRPGVAANPDSVRFYMERRGAVRGELLRLEEDEDREMAGYLTAVQRAQYQFLRQRLLERAADIRRQRQGVGAAPGRRPVQRPRQPPRQQPPRRRP
jgi:hypothetical protein